MLVRGDGWEGSVVNAGRFQSLKKEEKGIFQSIPRFLCHVRTQSIIILFLQEGRNNDGSLFSLVPVDQRTDQRTG